MAAAAGHFLLVALFAGIAASLFLALHDGPTRERVTFAFYLAAIVVLRVIGGISRAYAAPTAAEWRIPAYGDGEARRVHTGVLATMAVGAFGFFTCSVFAILGVQGDVHLLFLMSVGTVLTLSLAAAVLATRRALAHDLGADGGWGEIAAGPTRRRLAGTYPWALAVGTLLIWCWLVATSLLGGPPLFGAGLGTIGLLLLWPSLDAALAREALRTAATSGALTPAVLTVARVGLAVAVVLLLAVAWRIDLIGEGSGLWAATVRGALEVGTVVLVAYAGWAALRLWIDRRIAQEDAQAVSDGVDPAEAEIGGVGLSRMRTLLPLFKRAGQAAILLIAVLVALSSLGVAIAPVLAGAGVVGIAIGFGSQTLVRDIVSGAFFLMDDAFRLGEYIDLGSVQGSVEKINVRSLQLRHHRGALHTVPFGEITTLTNYSRDWAIMKLRFRVPFDTDVEKMRKVMKQVGKDLLTNPEIGQDFLQPLKSQGVVEVDDYGLIVRTKFMSKPGKQFLIRRHAYAAMQKALAENGIAFAKPEVRVSINQPGSAPDEGLADALEPAGAAALTAVNRGRAAPE
ncbi:MAG: mechanosensitive ion channel family protein [Rhodospirillaceae bacterium]|nr:mechanosensitive ion channel family protein [Rhodospirillaceae bacterium]